MLTISGWEVIEDNFMIWLVVEIIENREDSYRTLPKKKVIILWWAFWVPRSENPHSQIVPSMDLVFFKIWNPPKNPHKMTVNFHELEGWWNYPFPWLWINKKWRLKQLGIMMEDEELSTSDSIGKAKGLTTIRPGYVRWCQGTPPWNERIFVCWGGKWGSQCFGGIHVSKGLNVVKITG